VVRHANPLCRCRLRRTDVEVAVHLPGVGADDLGIEALGNLERDFRLAHPGRPEQGNHLFAVRRHDIDASLARQTGQRQLRSQNGEAARI
jgi:hypothetical protein